MWVVGITEVIESATVRDQRLLEPSGGQGAGQIGAIDEADGVGKVRQIGMQAHQTFALSVGCDSPR